MRKGIIAPLFAEIELRRRLEIIKEVGFDNLMVSFDKEHEPMIGKIDEVVRLCRKIGLDVLTAHAPYKEPGVVNFWNDNKQGDEIEKGYINCLNLAKKYDIKNVVFHLHFGTNYKLNRVGIDRLKRMLEYAEKHHINIAIENLYSRKELRYIFRKIKSDRLGMCYDSGHENFLTKRSNFLKKHMRRVKVLHLHDNDGYEDDHKTIYTGTIDWDCIAKQLSRAGDISIDLEVKLKRPSNKPVTEQLIKKMLKREYLSAKQLEEKILKLRK